MTRPLARRSMRTAVCEYAVSTRRQYAVTRPPGQLHLVLHVPMKKPTMCAFGGANSRTLRVTSLSQGPRDLTDDPHVGRLVVCRAGAQRLLEPRLAAL